MSWHVYRIFRVIALCALFCLHSILIGITSAGMLAFEAGANEALQFSMDIIVLFTLFCFSVLKYIRRDAAPSRLPNLIAFSILLVLSFIGAIGLTARGTSKNGKGLCGDLADAHPGRCTEATVAMAVTWVAVVVAGGGLAASWLDKNSRMGSHIEHDPRGPIKELQLPASYSSSRSHGSGPTDSYIARPRDPYDAPRRKYSTKAKLHRGPSNREPIKSLPSLPVFHPLALEANSEAPVVRQETRRPRLGRRRESQGQHDPQQPEKIPTPEARLSGTDIFAACG